MTQKSEALLRKVLEESPIGVAILERATGKRLFVNTALAKMFGTQTTAELSKTDISKSWVNPDDFKHAFSIFQNNQTLVDFETERLRVDGSLWWVLMNTQPMEFDGKQAGIVWHNDITERKRAERNQAESERRLRYAF